MDSLATLPGNYVYIVKTREFILLGQPVLKVGRTRNLIQRLRAYPIGSVLVACWLVHDDILTEKAMIRAVSNAHEICKCLRNFGSEWFQAYSLECERAMISLCCAVVVEIINKQSLPTINCPIISQSDEDKNIDVTSQSSVSRDASDNLAMDDDEVHAENNDIDYDITSHEDVSENIEHIPKNENESSSHCSENANSPPVVLEGDFGHDYNSINLRDNRDPHNVLTKFWMFLQQNSGEKSMSWDTFIREANAWAFQHGYAGPQLLQTMAERVVLKSGGKRKILRERGLLLSGVEIPSCENFTQETRSRKTVQSDLLHKFLNDFSSEGNLYCSGTMLMRYRKGAITPLSKLKDVFRQYLRFKHPDIPFLWPDDVDLNKYGYTVIKKHLCKSCGSKHIKGCCENYSRENRVWRIVVLDLEITSNVRPDTASETATTED